MWRFVMERQGVVFKFEGNLEEVSVETFAQAVLGYSSLIQATAREVSPDITVDVNISATRPGCIEALLSAVAHDLPGILGSVSQLSGQLGTIIATANDYLSLRKHLGKNGAPKSVEPTDGGAIVITQNGGTMNVTNLVLKVDSSESASKAAEAVFKSLGANDDVRGVRVSPAKGDGSEIATFSATDDEFEGIANAPRCMVDSEVVEVVEHQSLAVSRAVLEAEDRRKWQFFWNGIKISGSVSDKEFFERLASHVWTFGIGDFIDADLEITKRLNGIGLWENVRYRVVKVHDVISGPRDQPLFPDGN